jgi:hypothetical protein
MISQPLGPQPASYQSQVVRQVDPSPQHTPHSSIALLLPPHTPQASTTALPLQTPKQSTWLQQPSKHSRSGQPGVTINVHELGGQLFGHAGGGSEGGGGQSEGSQVQVFAAGHPGRHGLVLQQPSKHSRSGQPVVTISAHSFGGQVVGHIGHAPQSAGHEAQFWSESQTSSPQCGLWSQTVPQRSRTTSIDR